MRSLYHLLHTIICFSSNGEIPSPLTVCFQQRNSGVIFGYSLLTAGSHCLRLTGSLQEFLLSPSSFLPKQSYTTRVKMSIIILWRFS